MCANTQNSGDQRDAIPNQVDARSVVYEVLKDCFDTDDLALRQAAWEVVDALRVEMHLRSLQQYERARERKAKFLRKVGSV